MRIIDNRPPEVPVVAPPAPVDLTEGLDETMKRQYAIEKFCVDWGVERFNHHLETARERGEESKVGAAKKLVQMAIEPLSAAIEQFVDYQTNGKKATGQGGQRHCSLRYLEMLGSKTAAYLTIKVILDSVTKTVQVRTAAQEITSLMLDELKFRRFRDQCPELFAYRKSKFTTSNYTHMAKSMNATVHYYNTQAAEEDKVELSDLDVNDRRRLLIGIKLIDLALLSTGLFTIEKTTKVTGKNMVKTELTLKGTEETLAWLAERNSALEEMWPVNLPMVVPPLAWAPGKRGGYRFNLRGKHYLVRGITKSHAERLKTTEMPKVYNALNKIQGTAWRINPRMYSLLEQLQTVGGGRAGLPESEDLPDVPRPENIDTDEDVRRAWRRAQSGVKEHNHQRKLRAIEQGWFMSILKKFKDDPAIWFPHNLDFRGRIYPVTNFLSPQGDDRSKGVLMFAQGKPVGPNGGDWLALHGANCLGVTTDKRKVSKLPLHERVQWVKDHTEDILRAADEPLIHRWWEDADDPLQFIAFCFEWADYARSGFSPHFVSSLPCAMDGTCNGLQHYSAMLLDPVGAKAVNIIPSGLPQDIYQSVMDVGLQRIEMDATENDLARMWLESGLCDRKLAKAPVMTFAYGSKQFGFRGQIIDYVSGRKDYREKLKCFTMPAKPIQADDVDPEEGEEREEGPASSDSAFPQAASYMAKVMWGSLGDVVVAAQQAMSWMQKAARLIAKHGKCVEWRVPGTGYLVSQGYVKEKTGHIATVLAGKTIDCKVYTKTTDPEPVKQGNAISPNVVHSLDAAALMMTVDLCAMNGIESFAMVHDSYGVLAGDAPLMANMLRLAFYSLYTSNDVITSLYSQFREQLPAHAQGDLPLPPPKGTLDLAEVLQSPYFFC